MEDVLNFAHFSAKRPGKTVQTHIRLFLKKQSDHDLPVCYSDKHFVNSSLDNPHFIHEQKEKVFNILEHLTLSRQLHLPTKYARTLCLAKFSTSIIH